MTTEQASANQGSEASDQPIVRRPSGFVAKCQCGRYTGAVDSVRTDRAELAKTLGEWLFSGKAVEPMFEGEWSKQLSSCRCGKE